ncbi:MAG: gamma-butyrobetaine hydroxylase-like domain-containing protein [Pseudohongiellaceae bacterium]
MSTATPSEIILHKKSATLELVYEQKRYELSAEFLRVHSPSAEVKGHGPGQEVLQFGKQEVKLASIEPVGSYAIKPTFSDGHQTGIFTWTYLQELCESQDKLWQSYLNRLKAAGKLRQPLPEQTEVITLKTSPTQT